MEPSMEHDMERLRKPCTKARHEPREYLCDACVERRIMKLLTRIDCQHMRIDSLWDEVEKLREQVKQAENERAAFRTARAYERRKLELGIR